MHRFVFGLLVASLIFSACKESVIELTEPCTDSPTETHPRSGEFEAIVDKYIGLGVPGLTVMIESEDGSWMGAGGYADIAAEVPLQTCHINKVGSITKLFVGVLTNQLVEEGTLSYDDPVTKWLGPEITDGLENAECATLGQLLNHRACIYDLVGSIDFTLGVLDDPNTPRSASDLLEYAYGNEAPCACGEKPNYSNTHTLLVALIIDAATGTDHAELLASRIFSPLGLNKTIYYRHDQPLRPQVARGYLDFYNEGDALVDVTDWNTGSGYGYTGIYTTARDLNTFIRSLFIEKNLLSDAQLDRMFSDFSPFSDTTWATAYGGGKNFLKKGENRFAYGHGGGDFGYSGGVYWFPKQRVSFSFTCNYGLNVNTDLGDIVDEFVEEISDAAIRE